MAPIGIQKKYARANATIKKVVEGVKMTIPAAVIDETDYCQIASTYGIDGSHEFDTLLDKMNETARTLENFDANTISDNLEVIKEVTAAIAQKETALEMAISEVSKLREHLSLDEALRDEIYAFVQKVLAEIEKVDEDSLESAEDQITEHSDIIKAGALQMIHAGIDYENAWQFYHNAMLAFVKSNWEEISENLGDEE
ncbi:hypothetical protein EXVG_00171 [Emiliania huxleyi virus 202]|nr:hypothetical protein EXVG_00171 [Emiliania huxleyi virus 202]AHA54395.1 hypothetical protein EhV18_00349 [Emiliania huxleyi virus 18]AHA55435.1 hypothetical protein EhV156_00340 [Emiliania huxleyi virus 156]